MNRKTFLIQSGKAMLGSTVGGTLYSMTAPGSGAKAGQSPENSMTIFLAGDVMTGRGIDQVLSHSVNPQLHERYAKNALRYVELAEQEHGYIPDQVSYEYIWGDALQELAQLAPDACIINLETAVTTSDNYWEGKRVHYRMHPKNTPLLTKAEIDVCVLGNNHMLDWGYKGLRQTLNALLEAGFKTAGAGMDKKSAASPAIINNTGNDRRVLVFSYGMPTAGVPVSWAAGEDSGGVNLLRNLTNQSAKQVIKHIRKYRKEGDHVILSIHWGGNWGYEVSNRQQDFAHRMIDSGAVDIIHGHSSHHPKPVEVYNQRPILYGCGDLINDYEGIGGHEQFRGDLTLMYFPVFNEDGKLASFIMSPMQIRQLQLRNASKQNRNWLKDTLNRICEPYGTSVEETQNGRLELKW